LVDYNPPHSRSSCCRHWPSTGTMFCGRRMPSSPWSAMRRAWAVSGTWDARSSATPCRPAPRRGL